MSKKQETISDIVADIRAQNQGLPEDGYALSPLVCDLLRIADRIEAAAKSIEADRDNWRRQALDEDARANAATIKESLTVGNSAAIREALKALVCVIDKYDSENPLWWNSGAKGVKPLKDALAALTSPPRNCDIGTAEEQAKRHKRFCDGKQMKYCWGRGCFRCFAAWEQFAQQAECARHGVMTATVYRVLTPGGVCVAEFTDAVRACEYGDVLRASEAHYETDKEV